MRRHRQAKSLPLLRPRAAGGCWQQLRELKGWGDSCLQPPMWRQYVFRVLEPIAQLQMQAPSVHPGGTSNPGSLGNHPAFFLLFTLFFLLSVLPTPFQPISRVLVPLYKIPRIVSFFFSEWCLADNTHHCKRGSRNTGSYIEISPYTS